MFPAADACSVFGPRRKQAAPELYAAPLLCASFILCLAYAMIGIHRFFVGGLAVFTDDTILAYMMTNTFRRGDSYQFNYGLWFVTSPTLAILAKAGYFITTVFEALSPLCLLSHRFRRIWLLIMLPFHIATVLTMKILFFNNIVLILLLLTQWPYRIAAWLTPSPDPPPPETTQPQPAQHSTQSD